jgi:hypothetical protein
MDAGEALVRFGLAQRSPSRSRGREGDRGAGGRRVRECYEWMLKLYGRFDPEIPST